MGAQLNKEATDFLYLNAEDEDKIYILHHPIRKNDVSDL